MATTTYSIAPYEEGVHCSLCLDQLSIPPKKQAPLAPTFLRQLVDLLGFDVGLPLCDGCHGDVLPVIEIIRQINRLQEALCCRVVGIVNKKKVPIIATTWIISPPGEQMEQEELEGWVTLKISSPNLTSQSGLTLTTEDSLGPAAAATTTSQDDHNYHDQDPDICNDETQSFPDEVTPTESPPDIIQPTESTPPQGIQQHPVESYLGGKYGRLNKLITTLSINPPLYQCNTCLKKFKTKANVRYHQFCGNESAKPFKCEQCEKRFITKTHYEYHLLTHTGERPYPCSQCYKSFRQRSKLTRHIRSIHDMEKRFICDKCGAGFASNPTLQNHDVTHTGERPFPCKHCGKRWPLKKSLRKHEVIHTDKNLALKDKLDANLRTHECDQCTRVFPLKKNIKRHMATHTAEFPFKCDICATKFRRKDHLKRHVRNIHKGEVAPYLGNEGQTKESPDPEARFAVEEFLVKSGMESDLSNNDDSLLQNM